MAVLALPPTAGAVTNTAPPAIGAPETPPREGQLLTASDGNWTFEDPPSQSISREWRRCDSSGANCNVVVGTGATYTLVAADVGQQIALVVTATCAVGCTPATESSSPTGRVRTDPSNDSPPLILGLARDGETLTIANNIWSGTGPLSLAYQWLRCQGFCAPVAGATGATYTLGSADIGSTLLVAVTGDGPGPTQPPPTVFSPASAVVAAAPPVNRRLPAVGGIPREGELFGAWVGAWTGTAPLDYAIQWQRCDEGPSSCNDIAGADGIAHRLTASDVGKRLRIVVTVDNAVPGKETAASPLGDEIRSFTSGGQQVAGAVARALTPFPVVAIGGRLAPGGARVRLLRVRGPRGANVTVRCAGPSCPFRRLRRKLHTRVLRIAQLERRLKAGTVIEVLVTKRNAVGKYTRFRIRRSRAPARRDGCLNPGATLPTRCPGG